MQIASLPTNEPPRLEPASASDGLAPEPSDKAYPGSDIAGEVLALHAKLTALTIVFDSLIMRLTASQTASSGVLDWAFEDALDATLAVSLKAGSNVPAGLVDDVRRAVDDLRMTAIGSRPKPRRCA